MKRTAGAIVAALLAACGSGTGGPGEQPPLQYGAPLPPTFSEQDAALTAQTTLAPAPTFDPMIYGVPGLADALINTLGGASVASAGAGTATAPNGFVAGTALTGSQLSGGVVRSSSLYVSDVDPSCVTATATTAVWNDCVINMSNVDPNTGDTTDMTVTVNGFLSSDQGTGLTTWNITEAIAMTMTMTGAGTMTIRSTADLTGAVTVTASTIVGNTSSSATTTGSFNGIPIDEAYRTTLALDLGYETVPAFCITSGSLVLEQRWLQRPAGATSLDYPDQGWRFDWTGCGVYQVSHGS